MSRTDAEEGALFNSTASRTKAPSSYFAAPAPGSISNFIDNPFETWQSSILFLICIAAWGTCTVFLAIRYAQVLRFKQDNYAVAPLTLEAQQVKVLDNVGPDETYPDDESPVTSRLYGGDSQDLRRCSRAGFVQPKRVAIEGVDKGKIAQRRTSRARSVVARDIQSQGTTSATLHKCRTDQANYFIDPLHVRQNLANQPRPRAS